MEVEEEQNIISFVSLSKLEPQPINKKQEQECVFNSWMSLFR